MTCFREKLRTDGRTDMGQNKDQPLSPKMENHFIGQWVRPGVPNIFDLKYGKIPLKEVGDNFIRTKMNES